MSTFTGTGIDDTYTGSSEGDVISGGGGEDVLDGQAGNDEIDGGEGDDTLKGGFGNDILEGGAGNDFLTESSGNDGPFGDDIYDGGEGIDRVSLYSDFGPGVTVDLRITTAQDTGSQGIDTFIGIEQITSNYGDDTLIGNEADNWFWTFSGNDVLSGNGGDDLFTVGQGTKIVDGGAGTDTIEINDFAFVPAYSADGVTVSLLLQGSAQQTGVGLWTLTAIENLAGWWGADDLTGDGNANVLAGGEGNDTLRGGAGNDVLVGDGAFLLFENAGPIQFVEDPDWEDGNDVLEGGSGDDRLIGAGGNDSLSGGADNDTLDGGSGQDQLFGEDGDDTIIVSAAPVAGEIYDGGNGTDTLRFLTTAANNIATTAMGLTYQGTLIPATLTSVERLEFGSVSGSTLSVALSLNQMNALGEPAEIVGGEGFDQLTVFAFAPGTYTVRSFDYSNWTNATEAFEQGDVVVLAAAGNGDYTLNAAAGHLGVQALIGGVGNDTLNGSEGLDVLDGRGGVNTLNGGGGDDVLVAANTTQFGGVQTNYNYLGSVFNGGEGFDWLTVGGYVNFLGDLTSIEGINFQAEFTATGPGAASQEDAELEIQTSQFDVLPADLNLRGVGTLALILAEGESLDASGWVHVEGSDVRIEFFGTGGTGTVIGTSGNDRFSGGFGIGTFTGGDGIDQFEAGEGQHTATDFVVGEDLVDLQDMNITSFEQLLPFLSQQGDDVVFSRLYGGVAQTMTLQNVLLTDLTEESFVFQTGDDNDTRVGTDQSDDLIGANGQDYLEGRGGDDYLYAGANQDFLTGGDGNDELFGGDGNDYLVGGGGDDSIDGGQGRDQAQFLLTADLRGTWTLAKNVDGSFTVSLTRNGSTEAAFELSFDAGIWTVTGVNAAAYLGTDTLTSVEEFAFMFEGDFDPETSLFVNLTPHIWEGEYLGGILDDVMDYSEQTGPVVAWGNYGDDTITGTDAGDTLTGADGNDELYGGGGDDLINGNVGNDLVDGGDGDDLVRGGPGNDTVLGGAGNDNMRGGSGVDSFDGGTNTDEYNPRTGYGDRISFFELDATQGVVADLRTGIISNDGYGNVETMTNIESLGSDTAFIDTLYGNDSNNALLGNRGDLLYGFGGNDYFYSTSAAGTIDGGAGVDLLAVGSEGGWSMPDSNGDGVAESAAAATAGWNVNLSTGVMVDGYGNTGNLTGIENVEGSALGDIIVGDDGANVLGGGAGNDQLSGGAGSDTLDGADGNDTAVYANAGAGVTVNLSTGTATGGDGNDTLSGIESATGSGFKDTIFGNGEANTLNGGAGDDTLRGGEGDDSLLGGDGNDFLSQTLGEEIAYTSTYGNDIYDGGAGSDRVSLFTTFGPGVTVDLNLTTAQNTGAAGTDTFIGIEHLIATFGSDTLTGTSADNWFWTFAGTDVLYGNGGNDYFTVGYGEKVINGGSGVDTVDIYDDAFEPVYTADGITVTLQTPGTVQQVGTGAWTLTSIENLGGWYGSDDFTGDANANILAGGLGNDSLRGNGGNDTLTGDGYFDFDPNANAQIFVANPDGAGGNDTLDGGDGNDTLYGGGGNDSLDGGDGADSLDGGTGDDILYVDNVGDQVIEDAGEGVDTVRSSISYVLGDNVEQLRLLGTSSTSATGNALNNLLVGNAGHNTLDGGLGSDTMKGGAGNDIYYVNGSGDDVVELAGEGTDTVRSLVSYTLGANVEQLRLMGTASINATGNGLNNLLVGNSGNNILDGAAGADSMKGDAGNDVYYVDNIGDQVVELADEGIDTVRSLISYTLGDNVEQLRLLGESGIDGTGNALGNLLVGNVGNNELDGGAGADTMRGDQGDDIYYVDSSGDLVVELSGEGVDTVRSTISYVLGDNVEQLRLLGTANINATGNELNNTLVGNTGNNTLDGGAGADTMKGGAGNDIYYVNSSRDVVTELGGEGTDTVRSSVSYSLGANVEQLRLLGTANISATGNSLDNLLVGNSGDNVITGGGGADRMKGEAGADTFLFNNGHFGNTAATADVILDFSQAEGDLISLSRVDANSKIAGDQAFTFIGTGAFTGTAGQLRYQQIDGDTFVLGDTNGDGNADFMINLAGTLTLGASDFTL